MLQVRKFIFNYFQENCYVVWGEDGRCAIIDPGCYSRSELEELYGFIDSRKLSPEVILLTHAHLDHVFGVKDCIDRYSVPAYMDAREESTLTGDNERFASYGVRMPQSFPYTPVEDGGTVCFGGQDKNQAEGLCARALSTPGHSAGGLCWWFEKEKAVFTGDTLFAGTVGRTDGCDGSLETLQDSLRNTLMQLDGETDVYPGHGPESSIGRERVTNPFIYEDYSLNDLLSASDDGMN